MKAVICVNRALPASWRPIEDGAHLQTHRIPGLKLMPQALHSGVRQLATYPGAVPVKSLQTCSQADHCVMAIILYPNLSITYFVFTVSTDYSSKLQANKLVSSPIRG
jgi:hypothetical protein